MPQNKTPKRNRYDEDNTATPSYEPQKVHTKDKEESKKSENRAYVELPAPSKMDAEQLRGTPKNENPSRDTVIDPSSESRKRQKLSDGLSMTSKIAGLNVNSGTLIRRSEL